MTALEMLEGLPRLDLRGFVSPVQRLERFSEAIGVEVWCKRDDIGSVGLAGNKVRKLEVELAHAMACGATHLVAEGSRLSNAARAVAAAAAALGLKCTLLLCHDEPREPVGNLMLDGLFGADLRFVGNVNWHELAELAETVVHDLERSGECVYRLPIGCASERSCLGFALAYGELRNQMRAHGRSVGTIVHASSSGGTHAGLVLGNALHGFESEIRGIVVAEDVYPDVAGAYLSFAQGGAHLINAEVELTRDHINITEAYLGEGYGLPAAGIYEAIDLLATKEGLMVDPVYSGKAVAAIIDLAARKELKGPVVFWHTGGYHALFDPRYAKRIWSAIDRLSGIAL
ncbi:1-aminocyclopropane-1-carboxylate deaminase/D-cysteine desulfhydrase [Rhizobium esperanzae]|uniref:1-aminocyclopropane-1-carboxylate deaminase/D-cysteine desulfhydrase-like pyridoxal-dependent ACC family enzyme n=1 Tax=Rhizobium esperanzae TaxID=1967781 RepID=A0A7W6R0C6_9HYPH|nr:pyridoxal-phosphate dependent enzyme [Rhizobium esperanzae]MBB4234470.1 1-aminocyclopropane-1-carboxylate deaminase/D-cysteine desulfhydrase-like pyridoxal-dependent ACC family enzyme [Rhizobium esperanzae]